MIRLPRGSRLVTSRFSMDPHFLLRARKAPSLVASDEGTRLLNHMGSQTIPDYDTYVYIYIKVSNCEYIILYY